MSEREGKDEAAAEPKEPEAEKTQTEEESTNPEVEEASVEPTTEEHGDESSQTLPAGPPSVEDAQEVDENAREPNEKDAVQPESTLAQPHAAPQPVMRQEPADSKTSPSAKPVSSVKSAKAGTQKPRKLLEGGIATAVIAAAAVAVALWFTMFSPLAQGDRAYEEGEYQTALEQYEQVNDPGAETNERMRDCRVHLFLQYLAKEPWGGTASGGTLSVKANGTEGVDCYASLTSDGVTQTVTMKTSLGDNQVRFSGEVIGRSGSLRVEYSASAAMLKSSLKESSSMNWSGTMDLTNGYSGRPVYVDGTQEERLETALKDGLDTLARGCLSSLESAMKKSDTGCTMADFGFTAY